MESLIAVAQYTLKEHIRNRVYLSVVLFGFILIGGSVVISSLAVEEQVRMMVDVGLAGIEFLALITVLFVTVNLVLEEMESRSIYLILSHPVERWHYIVGRFVGTITALIFGMLIMALLHIGSLYLVGWRMEAFYPQVILCSMLKIAVVGSLALLISLITTSTASSMTLTGFLWVLGHFVSELKFMSEKSANPLVKAVCELLQYVAPNFSYFNYRDFWRAAVLPPASWFGWMGLYAFSYVGIALFLTSWIFSKKEF
jgi:ABC-type transport system involved in multi-copper enzyme maturation permease subunit